MPDSIFINSRRKVIFFGRLLAPSFRRWPNIFKKDLLNWIYSRSPTTRCADWTDSGTTVRCCPVMFGERSRRWAPSMSFSSQSARHLHHPCPVAAGCRQSPLRRWHWPTPTSRLPRPLPHPHHRRTCHRSPRRRTRKSSPSSTHRLIKIPSFLLCTSMLDLRHKDVWYIQVLNTKTTEILKTAPKSPFKKARWLCSVPS